MCNPKPALAHAVPTCAVQMHDGRWRAALLGVLLRGQLHQQHAGHAAPAADARRHAEGGRLRPAMVAGVVEGKR